MAPRKTKSPATPKAKRQTKAASEGIAPVAMVESAPKTKSTAGRPSDYNEEMAFRICAWIAGGRSLRSFCENVDDAPSMTSVYRWLAAQETFRDHYARAREDQADSLADEITDIADSEPDANKARVRIDARKWVASKLRPKKYGEKIGISGDGDGAPIQMDVIDRPEKETREEWIARRRRELGAVAALGTTTRPANGSYHG